MTKRASNKTLKARIAEEIHAGRLGRSSDEIAVRVLAILASITPDPPPTAKFVAVADTTGNVFEPGSAVTTYHPPPTASEDEAIATRLQRLWNSIQDDGDAASLEFDHQIARNFDVILSALSDRQMLVEALEEAQAFITECFGSDSKPDYLTCANSAAHLTLKIRAALAKARGA